MLPARKRTVHRMPHRVRWLALEDGLALVSSASNPTGRGHEVDVFAGTCGCKGFAVYKTCSHLDDARRLYWPAMAARRQVVRGQRRAMADALVDAPGYREPYGRQA
jgi:hypothetical protein